MDRAAFLPPLLAACAVAAILATPAAAQPMPLGTRIAHPDGASIVLKTVEPRADSILLAAKIANPGDREIRLDRAGSFVLDDGAHGVHHLNPPLDNPELRIAPHSEVDAELVFIGPLTPAVRQLTLSTNQGIGTADNPYDNAPVFRAIVPLAAAGPAAAYLAEHPDGVSLRIIRVAASAGACVVSLTATNGNARTIVLNADHSMALTDDRGTAASAEPPAENAELVVPAASRLDAELTFDCRKLDATGALILSTNRGTAGTSDNPYETLPVFTLRVPAQHAAAVAAAAQSRARVAPIARSVLTVASGPPIQARVGATAPSLPVVLAAAAAPPQPATEARTVARSPAPAPAAPAKETPKTVPQLEAALHASKGYHGLDIVLPADTLFGSQHDTLDGAADPLLANLAALIAATHPKEIVVAGHTDSSGSDDANMALSKARAQSVAAWLEAHLPKHAPKFVDEGYGRTRPIAPNHKSDGSDNPEGRAQNRRIEITLRR